MGIDPTTREAARGLAAIWQVGAVPMTRRDFIVAAPSRRVDAARTRSRCARVGAP